MRRRITSKTGEVFVLTKKYNRKAFSKGTHKYQLLKICGFRCLKCGEDNIRLLTIDHIISRSKGGKNKFSNKQILCLKCNKEKGTKTIDYRPIGMVRMY